MEEKKTVWLWNHYATNMFYDKGGRHHWFGKFLIKKGYDVKIFCATTIHGSDEEVDTCGKLYTTDISEGIEYVFVKCPKYAGNGKARIKNMIAFYRGVKKAGMEIAAKDGKPMVILASSVHPLTLVAGEQTAKKLGVPCICEVRDLWPETFVDLGVMKRNSPVAKVLYKGERWIYKNADKLIFTMPGARDYLKDQGLDKVVNMDDVYTINNGVDLDNFNWQKDNEVYQDPDLDGDGFKVLYTGAVRSLNKVGDLVRVAEICKNRRIKEIKFIVIGDGDDKEGLMRYAESHELDNIVFKDRVLKKYIPNILSKGDVNVVTGEENNIGKYGVSWNKLFEYMASGKPVVANDNINYDYIEEFKFGICRRFKSIEDFTDEIVRFSLLPKAEYDVYSQNALCAANEFDYKNLTNRLEYIILEAINA